MKFPLAAACVVLCTAAVSAQVASAQVASAQAGARTTVPGALTGSPEPVTRNPEPGTSLSALSKVQALYGSAAYEDALAAMPAPGAGATREMEQYRALCLLALGRQNDAAAAVDRITSMDPLEGPGSDTPPRLQAMYTEARVRLAPGLARGAYADAKAAWEKKDVNAAHAAFRRTLDLIAVLPDSAAAGLADLRELVSGFLQLTAAGIGGPTGTRTAPAGAPAAPAGPPATPAATTAAGAPETAPAADSTASAALEADWRGPVAVRQDMPIWQPPDAASRRREFRGRLRLLIDETGRVAEVKVVRPSHPAYDAAIARAARQWTFTPASRGGRPVSSEKDLDVYLKPQ